MRTWYTIKTRGVLGPEPHDDKEITVLNRKLVLRDGLITYEADTRIVGNIFEAMGLEEGSKDFGHADRGGGLLAGRKTRS